MCNTRFPACLCPAGDFAERGPEFVYKAAGVAEQHNNSRGAAGVFL